MKVIGGLLIAAGLLSVAGYCVYLFTMHLLLNSAVPLFWRLVPTAVGLGVILILISVIYDRLSGRDQCEEE